MDNEALRQLDENTARLMALEDALSAVLIALNLQHRPEIIGRFDMFIANRQAAAAMGQHAPGQLEAQRRVFQAVRDQLFQQNTEADS